MERTTAASIAREDRSVIADATIADTLGLKRGSNFILCTILIVQRSSIENVLCKTLLHGISGISACTD
jgi:hypothetical protein